MPSSKQPRARLRGDRATPGPRESGLCHGEGHATPEQNEPAVPPYEGRTSGTESDDQAGRKTNTPASSSGDPDDSDRTTSPADEQPASEQEQTRETDPGVGPAHHPGTPRGEDFGGDSDEAGREETGSKGASDRPTGESSERDTTGVDPQDGNR